MKLQVQIINCPDYFYNKKNNYDTDSGFDLYSMKDVIVEPGEVATIHTGVKTRILSDKISGYYLYPRSSISKTPLMMANSVGIIDYDYRGEIMAKVRNLGNKNYVIKQGTSLFQLCTPTLEPFEEIIFVDELDETKRGEDGFGSTNK